MCSLLAEHGVSNLHDIVFGKDRWSNMLAVFKQCLNCSNHLLNNVIKSAFAATVEVADIRNS